MAPATTASTERKPGRLERLAIERHARDLEIAARPGGHPRGLWFDEAAADRAVAFIQRYCHHWEGEWAGRPLILDDWQRDRIVRPLFGWRRQDGTRRYRLAIVYVPRKNGKSTICGALGLLLLVGDQEPGAQVYVTATKEEQAAITWNMAAQMIKRSPELQRFVRPMRKNLVVERTSSRFKPLGGDSRTLDALNAHGHISDETHAQTDPRVFWVVQTSQAARRQPLTVCISTAGVYDPESIGWQLYDRACKVLEGVVEDDSTFAFVAQADEGDDWFSEETQRKANPGFGISVKPSYLREQADEARRNPAYLNEYLRLHLNIWTRQLTRWLPIDAWRACGPEPERARAQALEDALAGRGCFGGLDLSAKLDLSALALVFPAEDGSVDVLARFWLPEAAIEAAARRGQTHYEQWARMGWLTATPGSVIDYALIRAEVNALASRFKLRELAYDPWGATQIATQLQGDGLVMVECRQGFKDLSEPSKELEALVVGGKLRHTGDPVLRFCVGNAVVARDAAGNIKPDKEKASERIDGVVATIMGLSRVVRRKATPVSPYATGAAGLFFV